MILDLGPASAAHLRLLRPFARRVRFAGFVPAPPRGRALAEALRTLPPHVEQPYDVVLAWNVLDLLAPDERAALVDRLADLTADGATLHALVDASEGGPRAAVLYTLRDVETLSQEVLASTGAGDARILPAQVGRVLAPFEVVRGFTLRDGLREYVATKDRRRVRPGRPGAGG